MTNIRGCYMVLMVSTVCLTLTFYSVRVNELLVFPGYVGLDDVKTIFVWDRPPWLFMKTGPSVEDFQKLNCEVSNCRLLDKSSLPEDRLDEADSILFTIRDFYEGGPRRTNPNQIWVFWIREAPLHYFPIDLDSLNDMFNLTFTYLNHTDTDIHSPVGKIVSRPSNRKYHPRDVDFVRNKSKAVAWVVSNCRSRGQRSQYVAELSKYIPVDIYGKCGQNCSRRDQHCMRMIEREYHFYLAFESMYCRDYVTEKMYRTLSYDVVPVVLGGADYASLFPERSYVDVRDFRSPRQLAKFLRSLMADPEEYLSYLRWKQTHMAIPYCSQSLCDLCKILHTYNYPYKSGFEVDKYWNPDEQCLYGHREREALHL